MSITHTLDDGLLTKRRYFPRGKYRLTFDCKDHLESQAAFDFEEGIFERRVHHIVDKA